MANVHYLHYLHQLNEVNGGDTVFIGLCVLSVCAEHKPVSQTVGALNHKC